MTYDTYRLIFLIAAILAGVFLVATVILFFILKIPKVIGDLSGSTAKKAIDRIRSDNEESGEKTFKASAVNKERGKLTDKISASGSLRENNNTSGFAMGTAKIGTAQLSAEAKASVASAGNQTTVLGESNQTTVLGESNQTTVLGESNQTTVLGESNQTTVLGGGAPNAFSGNEKTELLGFAAPAPAAPAFRGGETSVLSETPAYMPSAPAMAAPKYEKDFGATENLSVSDASAAPVPAPAAQHVFELLYDITIINTQEIIC